MAEHIISDDLKYLPDFSFDDVTEYAEKHAGDGNSAKRSYHVSRVIAVHGKPLSDGFRNCSEALFEDFPNKSDILKRIDELPIARNTVKEKIIAMNEDVTEQLLLDLKQAKMFSICLDESTDVTSFSRLAVFAKFSSGNVMKEELNKLMTLSETTKGQDVTTEFSVLGIDMENIVSVTTDGAPSTIEKRWICSTTKTRVEARLR
uniref:zinc finger BED domain-containing protein 5-like n=1 Tax=Styela clava TaxID=7725 RepID=UPI001939F464|nr:zinc finger BED domain-containing protein 5-like [Styela clava]